MVIFDQSGPMLDSLVSVLHQKEGGIGKSIPNGREMDHRHIVSLILILDPDLGQSWKNLNQPWADMISFGRV